MRDTERGAGAAEGRGAARHLRRRRVRCAVESGALCDPEPYLEALPASLAGVLPVLAVAVLTTVGAIGAVVVRAVWHLLLDHGRERLLLAPVVLALPRRGHVAGRVAAHPASVAHFGPEVADALVAALQLLVQEVLVLEVDLRPRPRPPAAQPGARRSCLGCPPCGWRKQPTAIGAVGSPRARGFMRKRSRKQRLPSLSSGPGGRAHVVAHGVATACHPRVVRHRHQSVPLGHVARVHLPARRVSGAPWRAGPALCRAGPPQRH